MRFPRYFDIGRIEHMTSISPLRLDAWNEPSTVVLWAPDVSGHPLSSLRLWGTQNMPWSRVTDVTYCTFGPTYDPPHFGRRHAGHTRARSRYHHGFPGAHQCAPGRQHVPGELPAAVERRYSRQSRHSSHKSRPREPTGSIALDASPTGHTAGFNSRCR